MCSKVAICLSEKIVVILQSFFYQLYIMTYDETIEYLYQLQPPFHIVGAAAYKPGLDNIRSLLSHVGNPHQQFHSVHVAGTNGKGSVSHLIASVLQSAGYKVGLYTSPHLVDFSERIRVNGETIDRQYVADFVEKNKPVLENLKPSFFETATMLAFRYFADMNVDVAVVEVGLGGRLDSTNVIAPDLSVITNIGYDHTQFLGNTLAQIAYEKAGIIKLNTPVVIGEVCDETRPVFIEKATSLNAPIIFAQEENNIPKIECELVGEYQQWNKQTAFAAISQLRLLGYHISDEAIQNGYAHVCEITGLRGRWETLQMSPQLICDTGHNSHAFRYVSHQLKTLKCNHLFVVIGMVDDKDVDKVLNLLPRNAYYLFTQAQTKRAIPALQLFKLAKKYNLNGEAVLSVEQACEKAMQSAQSDDAIFVGGSNYVVGEMLKWHNNCN